ncbi:MAG TPA: helix-turn-helix transcriptional regulator [Candidatus Limnocylindria bacterium]|jgi:transcriptional regulator with XRE-family HTH domain|nr:helix-turn-helix transcriptional regulator [Candidatus Limnocylindria bacterium]
MPGGAAARIGALLGDAREDAGLPQTAVARTLGVAQSRIAKLELGRRQLLFAEAVVLADLYGVDVSAFDPRTNESRQRSGRRQRVDIPRPSRE